MGSGKSTLGKLLAQKLKFEFIDLDDYITTSEECDIPAIFSTKGEIYFRKKEFAYLKEILDTKDDIVLSTGGGTPCYGENMDAINKVTDNVFYLNVSINELVARLVLEKEDRPLIAKIPDGALPEFIGKHLFERSYFYTKAHHTLTCDNKKVEDLVDEVMAKLV